MRAVGAAVLAVLMMSAAQAEMALPESTLQPPPPPGLSPRSGTYREPQASPVPRFEPPHQQRVWKKRQKRRR